MNRITPRLKEAVNWLRRRTTGEKLATSTENFEVDLETALAMEGYETGPLAELFYASDRFKVHKWLHYLEVYERHFARYRGTNVTMLEIGVNQGGSLDLWRRYFGPDATICGIDIDPACADRVDAPNIVRIGSQDDPDFLRKVIDEIGTPDIVLDDGSHVSSHQWTSYEVLFPLLADGGLYAIEDLHTSYYHWFEGGYGRKKTGVGLAQAAIDDLHRHYHIHGTRLNMGDYIRALHAYDSIAILEKGTPRRPAHVRVLQPTKQPTKKA